jgi:hypothetical protein
LGILAFSEYLWALSRSPVGPVTAVREKSVLFAMLFWAASQTNRLFTLHRYRARFPPGGQAGYRDCAETARGHTGGWLNRSSLNR